MSFPTDEEFEARRGKSKSMHVIISAMPLMGHFIPLVRLAEALEARGHNVTFLTFCFNAERCEIMLKRSGLQAAIEYVDTPEEGYTYQDLEEGMGRKKGSKLAATGVEIFKPTIKEKLEALNGDLLIGDFMGACLIEVADSIGLPAIVHCPMPIQVTLMALMQYRTTFKESLTSCCGIVCLKPIFFDFVMDVLLPQSDSSLRGVLDLCVTMRKRLVLSPTFIGFDPPVHLPPNLKLYGPAMSTDLSNIEERLANASEDLAEWMSAAVVANEAIVLVTLGSETVWQ